MRRLLAVVSSAMAMLLVSAAPALAQSGESSGRQSALILAGAIGAGVALFLLIIILFGSSAGVERDLRGRLGALSGDDEDRGRLARIPLLRRFVTGAEDIARDRGFINQIETALDQANMPLRPGEAIAGIIGIAAIAGLLVMVYQQSPIWGGITAAAVLGVSVVMIQGVAARHKAKFENQLPDTLNLLSTSLRSGYSLLQAVEAVAAEAPEPTAREFGRAMNETRLGRSPVAALKQVADRMESLDFDWAVLAISIQREVGGNLAEVLQTAADTMLQRNRLRREMKALTAEGRVSAYVLGTLPLFLFAFLFLTRRDYLQPMLDSTMGLAALGAAAFMLGVGIFWLSKIVKVDV
ncbi:MAG: type II secretion system F family protein [Acidimicrobiia bacterium]|nr:type II secretion system F family protein [Acidimicrobiia bacterium]